MTSLVTMEDVNFRLRLDLERDGEGEFSDDRVDGFNRLNEDATGIVLDYLKTDGSQWSLTPGEGEEESEEGEEEGETVVAVPAPVTAAIILVVRNLYDEVEEPLSEPVKNLLRRQRDPALA